jgi:diaminopimelate decarboxylase
MGRSLGWQSGVLVPNVEVVKQEHFFYAHW